MRYLIESSYYNNTLNIENEISLQKVEKQESEKEGEEEIYTMTWKNSVCSENHHYVIKGKFHFKKENSMEFTSDIYPKNPSMTNLKINGLNQVELLYVHL